jgi:DNA-directed RNA polymerase subunit RPC12/RpoP
VKTKKEIKIGSNGLPLTLWKCETCGKEVELEGHYEYVAWNCEPPCPGRLKCIRDIFGKEGDEAEG